MDDEFDRGLPQLLPRLWRFALRLTRQHEDAEDLVQRCYLRALERRHQWQPGSSLLSWLFAITHSIWMNELRSAQRRREGSLALDEEAFGALADPNPSNDPEYQLMYKQIIQSVHALPDAQRIIMVLIAVEGLSYREAADVLDVPIGTVMSRLARARVTIGQQFLVAGQSNGDSLLPKTRSLSGTQS
jgi:RNA polymerase sigma-70 factor, ECF subfamily